MKYLWFENNLERLTQFQIIDTSTGIYWSRLNTSTDFKDFYYICMSIASIGISYAEAEQLFSVHNSMLNRKVTNLGTTTLNRYVLHLTKQNNLDNE